MKSFQNEKRTRYYGLRIGDLVTSNWLYKRTDVICEVVDLGYGDNNRAYLKVPDVDEPVRVTAGSCRIVTKVEDRTDKNQLMKLYYFNPNGYGEEFFTMAESKETAHQNLLNYLKTKAGFDKNNSYNYWEEVLKDWEDVDINDESTYPNDYSLDSFDKGEVIRSEIA